MKHLEGDKAFQEGRRVAAYLEAHPCRNPKPNGSPCADCIAEAVLNIEDEMRDANERDAIDDEMRELAEAFAGELISEKKDAHIFNVLESVMRQGRKKRRN
jgi:hypothetical protein